MKFVEEDIFGNEIESDAILRNEFIENPFSVLDTRRGEWQHRKQLWKEKGLKSEVGRKAVSIHIGTKKEVPGTGANYTSIFDPALCEVLYKWFAPDGGKILDPFAGGSVRGIVANYLGYKYTGIEIREEQVTSNREQAEKICPQENRPKWIIGDSNKVLDKLDEMFDFVFSCPPYGDLETYSNLEGDISNIHNYPDFLKVYKSIIQKAIQKLKRGGFACFVVGEFRGKDGNFVGFVPDTIKAFMECGLSYYNEGILLNPVASASMRARTGMKTKKLTKIHQNILVFRKPE